MGCWWLKQHVGIPTPGLSLHRLNVDSAQQTGRFAHLTEKSRSFSADAVVCLLTVTLGAAYIGHFAWRHWLPWDDGTMAQAAERVLQHQLPHRDFNEPYTGGLTWLHAAAFRLFGVSIRTLRTTLFAFAVASIPIWYYVTRRFAQPLLAGVVTLTCIAWSIPNYPAPLPSWYNLFFAMAALAALLRYVESRQLGWVFAAGMAVGLSILAKITGVYLGAAIAVFLAFEATLDDVQTQTGTIRQSAIAALLLLLTLVCAISPLLLTVSAHDQNSLNSLVTLGLPAALVAGSTSVLIAWRWKDGWRPKLRVFWGLVALFAGAAVVLLVFTIPYLGAHAMGALIRGVFLRAQFRLHIRSATAPGPGLLWLGFSVPIVYACLRGPRDTETRPSLVWALLALWIVADMAAFSPLPGLFLWLSVRMLMLPLAILVAWHTLNLARRTEAPSTESRRLILVASIAAWCSLIQFPFTYATYFSYVAPLVIIATIGLAEVNGKLSPTLRVITLAGYCAFACIMRPRIYPERSVEPGPLTALTPPRGGILVAPSDARHYQELIALLTTHSRSHYTIATPDLPEVYFLSDLNNPTRSFFESLDYPATAASDVLKKIDEHGITVIVINHRPQFSAPVPADLEDSLGRRFPLEHSIGPLEVRWRP